MTIRIHEFAYTGSKSFYIPEWRRERFVIPLTRSEKPPKGEFGKIDINAPSTAVNLCLFIDTADALKIRSPR